MGLVPVIGMLAAFLGEIRPGPLGPEQMRLVPDIVPRLGNPLSPEAPVDVPDELGVAVSAAVADIEEPPFLLERCPGPDRFPKASR